MNRKRLTSVLYSDGTIMAQRVSSIYEAAKKYTEPFCVHDLQAEFPTTINMAAELLTLRNKRLIGIAALKPCKAMLDRQHLHYVVMRQLSVVNSALPTKSENGVVSNIESIRQSLPLVIMDPKAKKPAAKMQQKASVSLGTHVGQVTVEVDMTAGKVTMWIDKESKA